MADNTKRPGDELLKPSPKKGKGPTTELTLHEMLQQNARAIKQLQEKVSQHEAAHRQHDAELKKHAKKIEENRYHIGQLVKVGARNGNLAAQFAIKSKDDWEELEKGLKGYQFKVQDHDNPVKAQEARKEEMERQVLFPELEAKLKHKLLENEDDETVKKFKDDWEKQKKQDLKNEHILDKQKLQSAHEEATAKFIKQMQSTKSEVKRLRKKRREELEKQHKAHQKEKTQLQDEHQKEKTQLQDEHQKEKSQWQDEHQKEKSQLQDELNAVKEQLARQRSQHQPSHDVRARIKEEQK